MSTAYKANVPVLAIDSDLPSQTAVTNGKALISNGFTASWQPVTAMIGNNPGQVTPTAFTTAILPPQTGNTGKVLQTDGTVASWVTEPVGYTGSRGAVGYTGSVGATGTTGYTGSVGTTGYTGSQGTVAVGTGVGSYLMIQGTYSHTGGGGSTTITPFDPALTWAPTNPGGTWQFRGGFIPTGGISGFVGVSNGPSTSLPLPSSFPDPAIVVINALVQRIS